MKEAALVAVDLHAEGNGLLEVGEGGEPDEEMVGLLRDEDADIGAADGCGEKRGEHAAIRHEVG